MDGRYNTTAINSLSRNNSQGKTEDSNLNLTKDSIVGLTSLYAATTLLSVVGNALAVIVFARGKRSRTDLRPFLINLAVADLLMAIFCMPFTFADAIFQTWIFSAPMCPIVLFVQILSVASSVFTNMAIGIDRFLVVTFPLRLRFTQKRAKYVLSMIWIASIGLASVQLGVARGHYIGQQTLICNEVWPSPDSRRIYTIFVLLFTYVIPLIILAVTYSIVGILLWKRTSPGNSDHFRDFLQWRSKIKVVKMLVIVVAMFGLCWLPLHIFIIVTDFYPEVLNYTSAEEEKTVLGIYLGSHWLAMSNSFANPIIYGFTNESFRADLLTLFYMWFPCCHCIKDVLHRTNSRVTRDSVVFRRLSTLRRSEGNINDFKRNRFPKRVWSSLRHEDLKKNQATSNKDKVGSKCNVILNSRRHTICKIVVDVMEISDMENASVIRESTQ
ncbi:QRFP-like peptide receptor [Pecten maximus]|uniref:QRFP-like peptide receptor n=1 Tax=Pecten maximus TaxID=6579 RepID=UPI001458F7D2|nr:QRFP-like peptide receptor [Pecten maximus]